MFRTAVVPDRPVWAAFYVFCGGSFLAKPVSARYISRGSPFATRVFAGFPGPAFPVREDVQHATCASSVRTSPYNRDRSSLLIASEGFWLATPASVRRSLLCVELLLRLQSLRSIFSEFAAL